MATSTEISTTMSGTNYLSTTNHHSNNCNTISQGFTVFIVTAYTVICITGFILNSLAFWVYFCHISSSNSIIVYLKNLVIADFLLVLSLPIKILRDSEFIHSGHLNTVYCNFVACIFYLNIYSSICFLGYIAAIRYLKIVRPLKVHAFQNLKTAKCLSLGTWGVLIFLGILFVLLVNMENQSNSESSHFCTKARNKTIYTFSHIAATITFFCVLAGLCFFYSQISRQLHRSPSTQSLIKQAKAKNNILILLVVFLVCFVPHHIVRLPYILSQTNFTEDCYRQNILYYAKESSLLLSTLNACFDPVIYFLFCKAFRSKLGLDKKTKEFQLKRSFRSC
ncbi:P2Y purinoceptor 12-like [Hemiscyllium ocellatum]|uniref:P2Y purinoceptor 12-like n=1 Tax=Hemiscyllium ocellatum TaxID=170820 RepID=UPI002966AAAC|nr:P2Y purinoceptor 12-like [Hemiscyllium ocellatum]XP_060690541.1 P2Y purinoceptor 12-like [Hemiscyllium ocellatum]XP_060690542.1 P2Y purinoceptor 12-like [Hemiscyllium ocellatum]XP_060690543.1 P2Y purinoceptor 12-like [Hemiscyllium ocellatum]XP_060690544.1 P2Y purinoceptor 12-like [Hemiscyllium ocellatum]